MATPIRRCSITSRSPLLHRLTRPAAIVGIGTTLIIAIVVNVLAITYTIPGPLLLSQQERTIWFLARLFSSTASIYGVAAAILRRRMSITLTHGEVLLALSGITGLIVTFCSMLSIWFRWEVAYFIGATGLSAAVGFGSASSFTLVSSRWKRDAEITRYERCSLWVAVFIAACAIFTPPPSLWVS